MSLFQRGGPSIETRTTPKSTNLVEVLLEAATLKRTQLQSDVIDAASDVFRSVQRGFETLPDGFPPGPPGDSALELVQDPVAFSLKVSKQYGGATGLRLAGQNIVLVTDPILAKDVMIDRPQYFQKDGTAFFPNSSMAGNGLLVSDGKSNQYTSETPS